MTDPVEVKGPEESLRIGVLGAGGQLGRCLVDAVDSADDLALAFAVTHRELDVTRDDSIGPWLDGEGSGAPDVVLNAAAFTKVDACESEAELAYRTNALAPGAWARELSKRNIRFVHVSTDYVFPGDGDRPYREDDPTDPRTVYGSSKRAGEIAVLGSDPTALVVRTSWVFGPGRNFVVAILDQAARRRTGEVLGPLKVVDDQRGSPTYAMDLAEALLAVIRRDHRSGGPVQGLLHLRNAGETTWYGFACRILEVAGYAEVAIDPVPSSAFETAARRPAYSLLDCRRAARLGISMPSWTDALSRYLAGPYAPEGLLADTPVAHREGASG